MNSISWKDIEGDDSSLSDLSSDMEDHSLPPNHTNQLKKVLSSPPISYLDPVKKQNLEKLSNHQGEKVWVYSPNFYKGQEEQVNQIINNMDFVEESSRFSQGWNILLSIEHAKKLISEGFNASNFKLKFIYSTKNDKLKEIKEHKHKHKNHKNQRTYKSPQNKFDKPKYSKFKEKNNEDQNKPKKKVKYVAKEQLFEEKKDPSETSEPKKQQAIESEINEPEPLKEELQTNGSLKKEPQPEKETEVPPEEEKKQEYERDSEESLEQMKKKIKKKKNNKKKPKKQQGDNNNPFSFFDQ